MFLSQESGWKIIRVDWKHAETGEDDTRVDGDIYETTCLGSLMHNILQN